MADLERFLHETESGLPVLVKAALAHVQFETIHPFLDGNGRLGRLLIALLLHQGRLLSQPLLYLSLYFKEHRALYYEHLTRVRATGDWESWVDFFLEGVERTAGQAVETARRLATLFQSDEASLRELGRRGVGAAKVLSTLRERPLLTLNHLTRSQKISFPAASKAMLALVDRGIAREITGQRRNRVFVYDGYLKLLNEGGQPL